MAATGTPRIDALWQDTAAADIQQGDADSEAVGVVQDLLIGHGADLPGILGVNRGQFGPRTQIALNAFQDRHGLPTTGAVDSVTLHALAETIAPSPIAARGYLALSLDLPWTGFTRLVALTAQFEAAGKFTARNRNTDRAGLSFGIIQWAQKPKRLNGLLRAFDRVQHDRFVQVIGDGDPALAAGLIAHTAKPMGGVTALGHTTDPTFDLVNDLWNARFLEAGRDRRWQQVQLNEAISAYRESIKVIHAAAPFARSERAIAFLLDVANQHGDGGLRNICSKCQSAGPDQATFLLAVQNESVRRLKAQFGDNSAEARGTQHRRERFRTSPLLADTDFQDV